MMPLFAGGVVKHSLRSAGTPAKVSQSLQKQLNMYALGASAAGLGMMGLAHPANAKIVYTPAHVIIGHGGFSGYAIDLNHDGIADFALGTSHNSCTSECGAGLSAFVMGGNGIEGKKATSTNNASYAFALHPKARIGPRAPFGGNGPEHRDVMLGIFSLGGSRKVSGDWNNVNGRYLGFKFSIDSKTHYGWARLNVRDHGHYITATLTGYAYETIPNQPILAGATKGPEYDSGEQPHLEAFTAPAPELPNLGLLAMGSPGLHIWRREESNLSQT
jgi:hypothetical protein